VTFYRVPVNCNKTSILQIPSVAQFEISDTMAEHSNEFHVMTVMSLTAAQRLALKIHVSLELIGENKEEWRRVFLGIGAGGGDVANILGQLLGYSSKHMKTIMFHPALNDDVCVEVFVFDNASKMHLQNKYK